MPNTKLAYGIGTAIIVTAATVLLHLGTTRLPTGRGAAEILPLPPTPIVNPTADANFIDLVGPVDDLNKNLNLNRIDMVGLVGVATPSPNYIALLVLNFSHEAIEFSDIGFGIQVFAYDPATQAWKRQELPHFPERTRKILPAQTIRFDSSVLNVWDIWESDLATVQSKDARLFISGVGLNTGKVYGAFVDVGLQR